VRNVPYVVGYPQITTLYTLPKYRTSQGVQREHTQDIRLLRSCNAFRCDVNYTTNLLINSNTNFAFSTSYTTFERNTRKP
jgi:hypothetical protein